MICSNGHTVSTDMDFCSECGTPVLAAIESDAGFEPAEVPTEIVAMDAVSLDENSQNATSYCTNCGQPMDSKASICVQCGVAKYKTKKFCSHCGTPISEDQAVCLNCGYKIKGAFGIGSDVAARFSGGTELASERVVNISGHAFMLAHVLAALGALLALLTVFAFPLVRIYGESYSLHGMMRYSSYMLDESAGFHDGWLLIITIGIAIAMMFLSANWAATVSLIVSIIAFILGIWIFHNTGVMAHELLSGGVSTNGFTRFMFVISPLLIAGAALLNFLHRRSDRDNLDDEEILNLVE